MDIGFSLYNLNNSYSYDKTSCHYLWVRKFDQYPPPKYWVRN